MRGRFMHRIVRQQRNADGIRGIFRKRNSEKRSLRINGLRSSQSIIGRNFSSAFLPYRFGWRRRLHGRVGDLVNTLVEPFEGPGEAGERKYNQEDRGIKSQYDMQVVVEPLPAGAGFDA